MTQISKLVKLTAQIHVLNQQGISVSIEIGNCLEEAKSEFDDHERWLSWAESEFGYKKSHVYRLVAIGKEFPPVGNLQNYSVKKLYALVGTDEEFRSTEHVVPDTGKVKTVDEMSAREVEKVKRAQKEAERRAEEAEQRAAKAEAAAIHNEKLWRQAQNQPPRIETRTIEKTPDDYQMLKEQSAVAQRLNTENVQLKRDLMRQREEYELKLTQEDKRKAINRDLKKNCQELLQNQGMYTESILYNLSLSMGEREAAQIIEAFQLQYSHDVQVFMNKLKQMTTVSAVS